jgi:NAD(P)-dependent dehydrogenase (short-subunit alcohol dehydrogenase family)
MDWIVTGASRGIGRSLALALGRRAAPGDRLFALARSSERLAELAAEIPGCEVVPLAVDLSRLDAARAAGEQLAAKLRDGATLIHNVGVWPTKLELVDGVELGFAVNCLGPLATQAPLLAAGKLGRVLVVSAGLIVKGRFDPQATPTGGDFSMLRTYCTTKLAGAVAMREAARLHPHVDFAIVHPGVVNTELGDGKGLLAWIVRRVKRRWESPDTCAERLLGLLARERWQTQPGHAPWFFEAEPQPWPDVVERDAVAVLGVVRRYGEL